MSVSSTATLGALRLQSQQRADLVGSQAVSTPEWNQYISQSVKELMDMLIAAYGNDYYVADPYEITLNGASLYTLPADMYKLLGVDLQYSGSPTGWVTLKRFEFIERNKYSFPNTPTTIMGTTSLRYRLVGEKLQLIPSNPAGQTARIWYIPKPTALQFMPACTTTLSSATVSMADVTDLTVGMSVDGPGIQASTVISSINTVANTLVMSKTAQATQSYATLSFWRDDTEIDGIAGWEEYVIIDAAMKAMTKQEEDITALLIQKKAMKDRIEGMSEGRDAGQAHHVSDVMGINSSWDDSGGFGSGSGGGWL